MPSRLLCQLRLSVALLICSAALSAVCNAQPGTGPRWTSYQALAPFPTTSYNWLVVKCQLSDASVIPSGLDTDILKFFSISGTGYGNLMDYFHDVSYNQTMVTGAGFIGWIKAPFAMKDVTGGGQLAPPDKRVERVRECLEAIPPQQSVNFGDYYGVVAVTNVVFDGGACATGQVSMTIHNAKFNLACVWFDPNSLYTGFVVEEILHGIGLGHSFDNSGMNCSGGPGEYCDKWDAMSALGTHRFADRNWTTGATTLTAGPGLNAANLLRMGWIPGPNQAHYDWNRGGEQSFTLRALSHASKSDALVVIFDLGASLFGGFYTVEYRQGDGWDRGMVEDTNSPARVRANKGAVFLHQYLQASSSTAQQRGGSASTLMETADQGAIFAGDNIVIAGAHGQFYHLAVSAIDLNAATATVLIGPGKGFTLPPANKSGKKKIPPVK